MSGIQLRRAVERGLNAQFECTARAAGDLRVRTPFVMPDRDRVDVFVFERDRGFCVSDYGAALSWLRMSSPAGKLSPMLHAQIDELAEVLDFTLHRGQIEVWVSEADLVAAAVLSVGQAVVRIADLQPVNCGETPCAVEDDAQQLVNSDNDGHSKPLRALGSVTGRIESLSRRGDLHLVLVDDVFESRVTLHLREDQEELGRRSWNLHATVSGMVYEDPGSGHPTDVREITSIEPVPQYPDGAWRAARGIFPWKPGDPPAEQMIRELRGRSRA